MLQYSQYQTDQSEFNQQKKREEMLYVFDCVLKMQMNIWDCYVAKYSHLLKF